MNKEEYIKAKAACFAYELRQVIILNGMQLDDWEHIISNEESKWAESIAEECEKFGIDDIFYELASDTVSEYTDQKLKEFEEL